MCLAFCDFLQLLFGELRSEYNKIGTAFFLSFASETNLVVCLVHINTGFSSHLQFSWKIIIHSMQFLECCTSKLRCCRERESEPDKSCSFG